MERDTRLQGIFICLLIYLFISWTRRKERPSVFPKSGAPMETDALSGAIPNISFRVLSKGALPPGSLHRAPKKKDSPPPEPPDNWVKGDNNVLWSLYCE